MSPRMVMDHVPFRPNKALKDLSKRWSQDNTVSNTNRNSTYAQILNSSECTLQAPQDVPTDNFILPPDNISSQPKSLS